jgi:hypothetical protein
MKQSFIVTEDNIKTIKARYYGGGTEVKIGDEICYGYIMTYANLNGVPTTIYNPEKDYMSMVMTSFVLDKQTGMLYQLYSIGNK